MVRRPEVFVRGLDPTGMQRLVKITRTAPDRVRLRQAGLLASVPAAAPVKRRRFAATAQYAPG
jgi:hypothetical protein